MVAEPWFLPRPPAETHLSSRPFAIEMASHRGVDSGAVAATAATAGDATPAAAAAGAAPDAAAAPSTPVSPSEARSSKRLRGDDGDSLRAQHLGERPAPEAFHAAAAAAEGPTMLELDLAVKKLQHERRVDHGHLDQMWRTMNVNSDILTAVVAELNDVKRASTIALATMEENDRHLKETLNTNDASLKSNYQRLKDEFAAFLIDYGGMQDVVAKHMARAQELHGVAENLHLTTQTALTQLQNDFIQLKTSTTAGAPSASPPSLDVALLSQRL